MKYLIAAVSFLCIISISKDAFAACVKESKLPKSGCNKIACKAFTEEFEDGWNLWIKKSGKAVEVCKK